MADISFVVCLSEYLITYQSERRASEIGVKLLVFFTFFINVNQEHNLLTDCASGTFTSNICCENCISSFSSFFPFLSKSGNISF